MKKHVRRSVLIATIAVPWFGLHTIAVDSKGNIYTGEVLNGERVQRFVPVNCAPPTG
jgi:hypothetical protein